MKDASEKRKRSKLKLKRKKHPNTSNKDTHKVVDLCHDTGSQHAPIDVDEDCEMMTISSGLSPEFAHLGGSPGFRNLGKAKNDLGSPGFGKLGKSKNAIKLTMEQAEIIKLAKAPDMDRGEIIRVRAAGEQGEVWRGWGRMGERRQARRRHAITR